MAWWSAPAAAAGRSRTASSALSRVAAQLEGTAIAPTSSAPPVPKRFEVKPGLQGSVPGALRHGTRLFALGKTGCASCSLVQSKRCVMKANYRVDQKTPTAMQ